MLLVWRPLALTAVLLALSAQPSLARTHSTASRHTIRHFHAIARETDSGWQQPNDGWQGSSWRRQDAWQQQNSWQQQHFASNPGFGGYAENYPTRYSRRGRRYEQGWNSPSAEQGFGDHSQLQGSQLQGMAEQQASANGIPVSLVNRVIGRESGGNPRAVSRGNYGLMQIRLGTARAMGYSGSAEGLLDPSTNMTYAVRYLAGAYRAAGGNESRAVALYARGYRATPRVQEASYYGEQPQAAGFSGGGYYDSYAQPRMVRRERHYRHRES
jgi:soluble lytic murein transglycosylase-like protein